ncbi:Tf2-11, partial [Mucuna pruriens]
MKAFQELKERMTQLPLLSMPNFQLPFDVETDASGVGIGAIVLDGEQQKWVSKLLGYDFEIQYKRGKENHVAVQAVSLIINEDLSMIVEETIGGSLFKECDTRADVLSAQSTRITTIPTEFHSSPWGGHSGIMRTYKRIAVVFYWKHLSKDIEKFVQALKPAGLLHPLPIPVQVWEEVSMDFLGGLPTSKGKDTIMVVVDRLTKCAHFISLRHPYSAKDVAEAFISEVVCLMDFLGP